MGVMALWTLSFLGGMLMQPLGAGPGRVGAIPIF